MEPSGPVQTSKGTALHFTVVIPNSRKKNHCSSTVIIGFFIDNISRYLKVRGTAVVQWLRYRATNRKVAGSIPAGVSGFFIDIKSLRSHYGPGVDSASNRNEYQEYFLGVKAAGA